MAIDKNKIEKQAKEILDKFSKELARVNKEQTDDYFVDRKEFSRKETKKCKTNPEFKKLILKNAPNKDSDSIIAEKKSW